MDEHIYKFIGEYQEEPEKQKKKAFSPQAIPFIEVLCFEFGSKFEQDRRET
jgi:hypothetical protein